MEADRPIPDSALIQGEKSLVILLEVSRPDIVFFQALFESYEGLGVVRTMDSELSIIAILTTPDMIDTVHEVLVSISAPDGRSPIGWRFATHVGQVRKTEYIEQL